MRCRILLPLILLLLGLGCGGPSSPEAAARAFLSAAARGDNAGVQAVLVEAERGEGASWGLGENPTFEIDRTETVDDEHAIVHATLFGHTDHPVACVLEDGSWRVSYAASMRVMTGQPAF